MLVSHALEDVISPPTLEDGRGALARGDADQAVELFYAITQNKPADWESRYWLYSALVAAGHKDLARQILIDACNLHAVSVLRATGTDMERFRSDPAYCGSVGRRLYVAGQMGPATLALGKALDFDNLAPDVLLSYGLSMQHQGRMAEAIDVFTLAVERFPGPAIHGFLIYALFHAPDRLKQVSDEARRWATLYAPPQTSGTKTIANSSAVNRRLRIGYVGPSFSRNQVAQFLLPALESHDPASVEVFLYCADPSVEIGLPEACTVRAIGAMPDTEVVEQIRADGIDVLVDVWGHTAGSRLSVFGHRPAPVQVAWINFVQTTGLSAMDYVLHADSMDVPGTADYFVEKIWRMGDIMAPYRPAPDRPDPVPTPALRNGYVTFGSFNNPAKISEQTVIAWAEILRTRPTNRLLFKYRYYVDPVLQRTTQARFSAYGVSPEQLQFQGHSTGADYLNAFSEIDLALDPSPCPGGTTTCDALANGVPVLTLKGGDFFSRIGLPALAPCGLTELIADDWGDYVRRALDLTGDASRLDGLRQRVRPAFDASPYRDEVGFTRNLESIFREMHARAVAEAQ